MKKAIALVMTAVMALATPASVLAEEWAESAEYIADRYFEEQEQEVTR